LIAGDSDFEWAQFLIRHGVLDRELYEAQNQTFYDQYRTGTLDIHAFLDFQLRPLARHSRAQLDAWHRDFMRQNIVPIIPVKARQLIHAHAGALQAIITATNSFVTRPIADELGVTHLIATEPEVVAGEFTGRVSGTPSFREGKVERLREWLATRGETLASFEASYFYSDSLNDLPLLSLVSHPVAVDPDDTLRAHALAHDWPIMSLRYT
ncbi:MAG: HAD family hydrolase, partial [Pseudonocardiaceae bacterium]